jgi:hypothetical protein
MDYPVVLHVLVLVLCGVRGACLHIEHTLFYDDNTTLTGSMGRTASTPGSA